MKIPNISNVQEYFFALPIIKQLLQWSKQNTLPGFEEQKVYDVVLFVLQEFKKDNLINRANSISYSFFLSLFPTIIAFFTLMPILVPYVFNKYVVRYLPKEAFKFKANGDIDSIAMIITQIDELAPNFNGKQEIIHFIVDIVSQPRTGLFSFGFILALYFASNGMMSMMKGFEKPFKISFKKRSGFQRRLIALGLLFLLSTLLTMSIFLIIIGNYVFAFLMESADLEHFETIGFSALRYVIVFCLVYISITSVYRMGVPSRQKVDLFSIGASVATIGSILSTVIFSFYVNNFANFNRFYGSLGTMIVVMLWLQLNITIILIGNELNASILVNKALKNQNQEKKN